jgi:hypothetical protein
MKLPGLIIVSILLAVFAIEVLGGDAGDLVYPIDLEDRDRVEVIYERVRREVDVEPSRIDADPDADVLFLRLHTDVGEFANLAIDAGVLNSDRTEYTPYLGGGLRYLVYDQIAWRIGAFAQVHYARDVAASSDVEYRYTEAETGVLFGRKYIVLGQIGFVPYAGPIFSLVRIDGDERGDDRQWRDFDGDERNAVGGVVGASFQMQGMNGFRVEARIFEEISYSVGVAAAF